jgi:biotin transport system ATP-binding protein
MITVRNLVARREDKTVLDGISLTVEDGEWVVLAGRNGSGKTTLVRHCNGLLEPIEGEVLIDGVSTTDDSVTARTRVGMVFQNPRDQFVAATVGADVAFGPENLGLTHEEIDRRVEAALDAVNMTDSRDERIESLSGGQQARVAIAGALAMEPAHLVLDEPLTGLDWPTRRSLLEHLQALHREGTSLVFATHDLRDVFEFADRVVGLAEGTVAVDCQPAEAESQLAAIGVRPPAQPDRSC